MTIHVSQQSDKFECKLKDRELGKYTHFVGQCMCAHLTPIHMYTCTCSHSRCYLCVVPDASARGSWVWFTMMTNLDFPLRLSDLYCPTSGERNYLYMYMYIGFVCVRSQVYTHTHTHTFPDMHNVNVHFSIHIMSFVKLRGTCTCVGKPKTIQQTLIILLFCFICAG